MEDKLKKYFLNTGISNIKLFIFKGEVNKIINNNKKYIIRSKTNLKKCNLIDNNNLILKKNKIFKEKEILTEKVILGTGILPPDKINTKVIQKNKNYIWNFYNDGGTLNLINKIKLLKKNLVTVAFIGNKAGLLETCQQLEKIIISKKIKLKIISISSSLAFLQKANLSKNYYKLKLKYFNLNNIAKINQSNKILLYLIKEFNLATKKGFNKYDVWTKILNENLLSKIYKKLSVIEKKKYNSLIFNSIRNLTRFTYPETVESKNSIQRKKKLIFIKDKVVSLILNKKIIKIKTLKNKTIKADMAVNVSGPLKISNNNINIGLINSLKKICYNYTERGFVAKKNYLIGKNIYAPGTLSNNFNPSRQTIIKAITNNSKLISKQISNTLNKKN